jgi:NAD(P)-dependent dehydrogenase (short-subunit alcohol dehydrogenase family)
MADNNKSDRKTAESRTLASSGRARRQFLGGAALAAAGTSAALITRSLPTLAADSPADVGSCASPAIHTPMKDVAGKVAFITGGNSGIGLGIARAFFNAGMKVAITYRTKANLDEAMTYFEKDKDRVYAVNVDVTDRAALEKAADDVVNHFGKVNVVVANAGVAAGGGGVSKASYDDWDWGMSVDLNGVFNTIRAFLPRIQANGEGGAVVATSSLAGLLGHGNMGVYTAAKFGVVGLMESLRFEMADSNIAVTVFCPGVVTSNIGNSARNRPDQYKGKAPKPAAPAPAGGGSHAALEGVAMDPLEAGNRVLKGMRNNDLYVLTTPDFEDEFRARGEAIVASVPTDVKASPERVALGHRIAGKMTYVAERDRKQCERKARTKKA